MRFAIKTALEKARLRPPAAGRPGPVRLVPGRTRGEVMFDATDWGLVFRYLIPAVYVPIAALIGFALLVAVTGIGTFRHIEQIAYLVTASSFVLVFARLASRDLRTATQNVTALASFCFIVIGGAGAGVVGWRLADMMVVLAVVAVLLAITAAIGLRWARRWKAWRIATGSAPQVVN